MENRISSKEEFLRRKVGRHDEAVELAQRLINVYRQLEVFSKDDVDKYNHLLVSQMTSEVYSLCKTIPGGEELRSYYTFLTKGTIQEEETSNEKVSDFNDLLPTVEELSPLWSGFGKETEDSSTRSYLNEMISLKEKVLSILDPLLSSVNAQSQVFVKTAMDKVKILFDEQIEDKQKMSNQNNTLNLFSAFPLPTSPQSKQQPIEATLSGEREVNKLLNKH